MKILLSTFSLFLITLNVSAQGIDDALRYSLNAPTGTARSMAMGNAFGALGGDFSSIGINPAGLAIFRGSEFSVTPSLIFNKTESDYSNTRRDGDGTTFVPNQMGFVWTVKPMREVSEGVISSHFSIGYQRTANFNLSGFVKGEGVQSSLLDQFVFEANGYTPNGLNNFKDGMAYDMKLLQNPEFSSNGSPIVFNNLYYHAWQKPSLGGTEEKPDVVVDWRASRGINQQRFIEQEGYKGEFNFSYGANINNNLFLGASLNVLSYRFRENMMHAETPNGGLDATGDPEWDKFDFSGFDYRTYLDQRATGVNLKLGVIYKPIHEIRVGLAYHTPSVYRVDEEFQGRMNVSYAYEGDHLDKLPLAGVSPLGTDEYRFRTPDKLVASLGAVLGNMFILSFDYERSNYRNAKYKPLSDQYRDYSSQNDEIRSVFSVANTYRVGAEYKVTNEIALRAGYGFYGSPIKSSLSVNKRKYETFSGGLGYRMQYYYVDAVYYLGRQQKDYFLYSWDERVAGIKAPTPAKLSVYDHQVAVTVGYRF